jgi:polar amino acid transport system substrate-binding protein
MLPGLLAKKYDMIGSPVYMKADRFSKFNFTVPTSEATTGLLARKDDPSIRTVDDIVGKVVGGQQGSGSLAVFKTFNEELKKRKGAGAKEIKEYVAPPEALADLGNKRVDAYVDAFAALGLPVRQSPEKYRVLGAVGPKAYFGWVTRLEDKELRDYLSERIIKLKKDGTIDKLQQKWFGLLMDNPSTNYEPKE